jgi:prephenate dehydrogenase
MMSSQTQFNISRDFKRVDPSLVGGHPMRGSLKEKIHREHLLRREDNDPKREKITMMRDVVISVMGGISAMVPVVIAFQSVMGV